MTSEPIAEAAAVAQWVQDESCSPLNVHDYPTFYYHNHLDHSVCDLMVANARAIDRLLVPHWEVDEEAQNGSFHSVIRSRNRNKRFATTNLVEERPNWRKANEESHNRACRAALDKRKDKASRLMNQERPTREAREDAADAIREAHHDTMKRTLYQRPEYANIRYRTGTRS